LVTNEIKLPAGGVWMPPPGWYMGRVGKYSTYQELDPISQAWRSVGGSNGNGGMDYIWSDGQNYRVANQSGCAVGALLTNGGSGYTSAPTVTASAGSSIWRAVVGGAISTTVSIVNAGSGYIYPPILLIPPPPPGGIQAAASCSITTGGITSVSVTDQGGGYLTPPPITIVNDPREGVNGLGTGTGAALTTGLTGSGAVVGLICLDHGTPLTAVPTLSFSGGGGSSAAATAIMNWGITAITAGTAGAGLSGTAVWVTAEDAFPTASAAYVQGQLHNGLVKIRKADVSALTSGTGVTATGAVIYDAGVYTSAPVVLVVSNASIVTTAPVVTAAMGGTSDVILFYPT
jgi:hypothetical protein